MVPRVAIGRSWAIVVDDSRTYSFDLARILAADDVVAITLAPETEELAKRVAATSGRTPEEVLRQGLEREAQIAGVIPTETRKHPSTADSRRAKTIARRIAARPLLDARSPTEILREAWDGVGDRRR
jgi:hypothetical protein